MWHMLESFVVGRNHRWVALWIALGVWCFPTVSAAISFDLNVEFDTGLVGSYASITIEEDTGADPSVAGGAGADFDFAVNFGNGAGRRGNGALTAASFRLSADQPLSIAALLESSLASGRTIESQFAAHIQGTNLLVGSSSETVGGMVPEPATGALVALGVLTLAAGRRRRRAP
jgi:hypothetical protein